MSTLAALSPEPSPDLASLLRRVAQGDKAALATLFESEAGRLIGVALRIVRRRDLAEEIVQDSFVAVWQRAGQFDGSRGSPRGWLTRIVRNRALNLIRDGARVEHQDTESLAEIGDQMADAELAFDRIADQHSLKVCLGRLDIKRRRAIVLCYVTGLSHGEVAALLRTPLGTVKAWIRRGLITLQECMA